MSYRVMKKFSLLVANTVANLSIPIVEHSLSYLQDTNPILTIVNSYDKYPSIERIKYNMPLDF